MKKSIGSFLIFIINVLAVLTACEPNTPQEQAPQRSAESAPVNTECDTSIADQVVSQSYIISPTQDIIPLCSGKIIYQNQTSKKIVLVDSLVPFVLNTWQLTGQPTYMILDKNGQYLYIAMASQAQIAKIDITKINSSDVTYINTSAPAVWLALGNNNLLFANLTANGLWGDIDLINVGSGSLVKTFKGGSNTYAKMIIYNTQRDELITGQEFYPASLKRYSFDSTQQTLTLIEEVEDAGEGGKWLTFSTDYKHFIFNVSSGNDRKNSLYDYSPSALGTTQGSWTVGSSPVASAFSSDGNFMLTTDTKYLKIFNVITHTLMKQIPLDLQPCPDASGYRVGFSREGKFVFASALCGSTLSGGVLFVSSW